MVKIDGMLVDPLTGEIVEPKLLGAIKVNKFSEHLTGRNARGRYRVFSYPSNLKEYVSILVDRYTGKSLEYYTKKRGVQPPHLGLPNYSSKSPEQWIDSIKPIDNNWHRPVKVEHWVLNESLFSPLIEDKDRITNTEFKVLYHLLSNLACWNRFFGTVKDVSLDLHLPPKSLGNILKKLGESYIKVVESNRYRLIVDVSPYLAFKGGYEYREAKKRQWYS